MIFTTSKSFLALLFVIIAVVLTACGRETSPSNDKMLVAVSIAPLADFARQVGGDNVDVVLLVPPAASPHTYQLSPSQMETLSKAKVLVLNGVGLEFWADKAIEAANNPDLIVVRTADGIPIIDSDDDHEEDHGHEEGNPHVWLNPVYAIKQVNSIRDAFIKADPDNRDLYESNASGYIEKLEQLDEDIRKQVETFSTNRFIAFHPAWVYFAREYGLVQVAVIEESPGREPSAAEVQRIVDAAKRYNIKAIFAEPQFSSKAAEVIAGESGAEVLYLDPLGQPPDYNYIDTMRVNLEQMAKAMK